VVDYDHHVSTLSGDIGKFRNASAKEKILAISGVTDIFDFYRI